MNRQGRILLVDDDVRWCEYLAEKLTLAGFWAETATSVEQALARLRETYFHLLILDIRMVDADKTNTQGMTLLEQLKQMGLDDNATQVIMLSAYGTMDQMRTAFKDYSVADFLDKRGLDSTEFRKQVQEILSAKDTEPKDKPINLKLDIHWPDAASLQQITTNLEIDNTRIKRDSPLQKRAAEELDDLLCRLFSKADSIMVRPLTPGRSGAGVLWVQPFYGAGAAQAVVVKFGDFAKINQESGNYREFVQPFIGGARSTNVLDLRRTAMLGGIVYSMLGLDDQMESFSNFYRKATVSQIRDALDRLFLHTCGAWYASPGKLQPHDLTKEYLATLGLTPERLEQSLADRLKTVEGKDKLRFRSLATDRKFANPIQVMAQQRFMRPTYSCITHGDLNPGNILMDQGGDSWLIDFFRTGEGHILRDVVQLDCSVRLELLDEHDATLDERLNMEETLLRNVRRFSDIDALAVEFPSSNPVLVKAYAISAHLRGIARKLMPQNLNGDISEYYIGLMFFALHTMRFYGLSIPQREHALLSASLLAEQLTQQGHP